MKHWTKRLLALVVALSLTGGVLCVSAAGEADNRVCDLVQESGYTLTMLDAAGNPITTVKDQVGETEEDVYKNVAKIRVNFTGEVGKQYVVFLLSGESQVPQKDNIAYIDQKAGQTEMEFVVYPSQLVEGTKYTIRISSTDGLVTAGSFTATEAEYILGDANKDGTPCDIYDVVAVLRYIVELIDASQIDLKGADVNGDDAADIYDVVKMLRVIVELETL